MKTNLLLIAISMFAMSAQAQRISQSLSQEFQQETVSCLDDETVLKSNDNSYYRSFDLSTFGITTAYHVSGVEFGVTFVSNVEPHGYPVFVNLYTTDAQFPNEFPQSYELIATDTIRVFFRHVNRLIHVPLNAVVPVGKKLIMEVGYDKSEDAAVIIASNSAGETGPSFIKSTMCQIDIPVNITSIGFEGNHLVFNVLSTLSASEVKATAVAVYPNPSTGLFKLEKANVLHQEVEVLDVSGKRATMPLLGNSFDLSSFAAGIYTVQFQTSTGIVNQKIIKI